MAGMYAYKMYGRFDDITANEFLSLQLDTSEFRLSWDPSTAQCHVIKDLTEQDAKYQKIVKKRCQIHEKWATFTIGRSTGRDFLVIETMSVVDGAKFTEMKMVKKKLLWFLANLLNIEIGQKRPKPTGLKITGLS